MILQGKVFISTVSAHKSVEIRNLFEPLGVIVVDFPMTEIVEVEQTPDILDAIKKLDNFQWIIFTSANGVIHFQRFLREIKNMAVIPPTIKVATVGVKTAHELERTGRKADFSGSGNTSENLASELLEKENLQNCNILLPLGNLAPDTLTTKLSKIAYLTRIDVYKTIRLENANNEPIERIKNNQYDLILFTSSSGVENFVNVIGQENIGPHLKIASIGNVTTKTAESHGFTCGITAAKSTYEGLVAEIVNYYTINIVH
jgi:uroporphyrinogen-III synthase